MSSVKAIREFLESEIVDRVAGLLGVADARLRVNIAIAHLVGAIAARYVLEIEPYVGATEDEFVALVAPVMQNALTTPVPRRRSSAE
jgi:hypothetical protein